MKIDGIEITCLSEYDGKPVKNHLPAELRDRLMTKNQWLEQGCTPKENEQGYEMHSNMMGKRLFVYYLDSQVEKIESDEEMCANCSLRTNRFCIVMGDYVKMDGHCSEWDG